MVQEETTQKTVALVIKGSKLSGRVLAKAIQEALRKIKNNQNKPHHGKQTIKQLAHQNGGLSNIEITDGNIKSFESVARKYGVDFALKRDHDSPPKWLVFFKARDADALTAAFTEFSRKALAKSKQPSVREMIQKLKALIQEKVLNRSKIRERSGPER